MFFKTFFRCIFRCVLYRYVYIDIYCIYCILYAQCFFLIFFYMFFLGIFCCMLLHAFRMHFACFVHVSIFTCILHAFHMLLPVFSIFFTCFVMLLTSNVLCTSCGKKCMQKKRGMWHGMCCILCQEKRPSKAWLQFRQGVGHSWPSFLELGHSNV